MTGVKEVERLEMKIKEYVRSKKGNERIKKGKERKEGETGRKLRKLGHCMK